MSRPDRTSRRRRLVGLVAAAFGLGLVATPPVATAQTDDVAAEADIDQFGGFIASARGNGVQLTYDSPGLLPTGSPIFELSVPEALATLNSGPVGYALSSFAFPGPLIADLDTALAAGGTPTGIPPYPVRSEAFFPSGPTEVTTGDQGTEMVSITEFADSRARSSYSGIDVAPAGLIGSMTARSQSVIESDQLVTRARTEVSDISLVAGLIQIESVVTDLVATSNGTDGATGGGTTISGATVLGLPVTIDGDGIRFDERPAPEGGGDPVSDAVDGLLGGGELDPVTDALDQVVGPLNDLLAEVGGARDDALQQLFEQSGIKVEVLEPIETVDAGTAERTTGGLSVTLNYDGANTPVLTDLLALVPSDDLPAENLGPIPFSPQAIAKLLEKQHIIGLSLATADVSAAATPAFEFVPTDIDISSPVPIAPSGGTVGGATGSGSGGDFASATPALAPPAPADTFSQSPASTGNPFPLGDAIPALLALAVALGSPFFAAGSSRLADNTLAAVGTSCPAGLDLPPQEIGS